MTNRNTFDGLRFRVMETLERTKGVPLTALEITQRLHAGEYRDTLLDTLGFKVTAAVRSMTDKGQLITSDARDKAGRATYQLPQRLAFPPKVEGAPSNPVLTAAIAEKIVVVDKPAPKAPSRHTTYAPGVSDAVLKFVKTSPTPVIAPEITVALRHLYPPTFSAERVSAILAGTIYGLKAANKIKARRAIKRGTGIKYEYYVRKAQLEAAAPPAPLLDAMREPAPMTAEERSRIVEQPDGSAVYGVTPRPALFRPVAPVNVELSLIKLGYHPNELARVEAAAARFGVPVEAFCKQAIEFAMAHSEGDA